MTLTSTKRRDHPHRYARRDARTLIYRQVYGEPAYGTLDYSQHANSRRVAQGWNWTDACNTIYKLWPAATFNRLQASVVTRDLNRHCPQGEAHFTPPQVR